MPTKINAFSAVGGEAIQLIDHWFGTQLGGGDDHHHHHSINNRSHSNVDVSSPIRLSSSVGSLSSVSDAGGSCRIPLRQQQPYVVDGLTFEQSDEAQIWTLSKRKLLAIIAKADCFVSARTCPYDVLVGVSVVDSPEKLKEKAAAAAAAANNSATASTNADAAGASTASFSNSAAPPSRPAGASIDSLPVGVGRGNFAGAAIARPFQTFAPDPGLVSGNASITVAAGGGGEVVASPSDFGAVVGRLNSTSTGSGMLTPIAPMNSSGYQLGGSTRASRDNRSSVAIVADPAEEPQYRPWPVAKSTLGEVLTQCADEAGVALTANDDAPKASDAVGFAAAMVAKLCRKAVLHNPNRSEAHFVVNLLVFSRPVGNEYAPSHGLYRVPHAPSAVTKERCSSAVVLSVIGKVMEETRLLATNSGNGGGSAVAAPLTSSAPPADGSTAAPPPTNSYADRPPLPRAAIGVAEKVKQHGAQLLQELHILQLSLTAAAENARKKSQSQSQQQSSSPAAAAQREVEEFKVLEKMLHEHFANSIEIVVQFTGAEERDALFALMECRADLESAAARLMEGLGAPGAVPPLSHLRQHAKDYLDQQAVNAALSAALGNCLGAQNAAGLTASGAPQSAAALPLVACADRLISLGYSQEEANKASRGAGGSFDLAASFLAGDHGVQRHVRQRHEEVLWFNTILEAIGKGSARVSLAVMTEVVSMVAKDPQAVLTAWHTPHQQPAVKMLSDAFVQAIMQHKQQAMLRMQQQQQLQQAARAASGSHHHHSGHTHSQGGHHSSSSSSNHHHHHHHRDPNAGGVQHSVNISSSYGSSSQPSPSTQQQHHSHSHGSNTNSNNTSTSNGGSHHQQQHGNANGNGAAASHQFHQPPTNGGNVNYAPMPHQQQQQHHSYQGQHYQQQQQQAGAAPPPAYYGAPPQQQHQHQQHNHQQQQYSRGHGYHQQQRGGGGGGHPHQGQHSHHHNAGNGGNASYGPPAGYAGPAATAAPVNHYHHPHQQQYQQPPQQQQQFQQKAMPPPPSYGQPQQQQQHLPNHPVVGNGGFYR